MSGIQVDGSPVSTVVDTDNFLAIRSQADGHMLPAKLRQLTGILEQSKQSWNLKL